MAEDDIKSKLDADTIKFVSRPVTLLAQDGSGQELEIQSYTVAPESMQAMDDQINEALAKAGLPSLEDLR